MIKAKYYILSYILYFYSIIVQQYLHDTLNLSQPLDFFWSDAKKQYFIQKKKNSCSLALTLIIIII